MQPDLPGNGYLLVLESFFAVFEFIGISVHSASAHIYQLIFGTPLRKESAPKRIIIQNKICIFGV